jgi:plastocyanin
MHYKWETVYSHPMNMRLNATALAFFAGILFFSSTGNFISNNPIYGQTNSLPGSDGPTSTIPGNGDVGSSSPPTAGPRLSAADIAQTNTLKLDSDVKNLVILIPDKRLITQSFLPLDATIVQGTKVIWSNADKDAVHGITLQDSDMEVLLSNETIPYKNGTEYTFDTQGTYTFSDPSNPSAQGTINVIAPTNAPDNLSTNSTQATAGLFVVKAADKAYFDKHFNTLGYHVEDSYMIPGSGGNDIQVYVYTQKSGKYPTIVDRTAVKSQFIDDHIEG